ncbi:MAG: cytochrome c oxidase assembly protein [Solirubrobacterales bacterium]|nr:cytochrome c oxidase assembly protein [Solirubrobacterales bacterium]
MALDPGVIAWLLVAEALYLRALRILGRRGLRIGAGQQTCWHAGIALQAVGLLSPVDSFGEDLLAAHMAQHLLIADLAAPLLLAGLRTPVLLFVLPRPVLVALARRRRLRAVARRARRPLVALPLYGLVLYGWHLPFAFEAAVTNPAVHALQHASFVGSGILVWWSALEPNRRRLQGELWKIGHMLGARLIGMFLGMAFVLIRVPVYTDVYGDGERGLGLGAVHDQQLAGALMVVTDILLMVFVLSFFFLHAAREQYRTDARERASVT